MSNIRERSGKLVFDFTFKGIRCRETSRLSDTKSNRKIVNDVLKRIDAEIIVGSFCYERYFPKSKKVDVFSDMQELQINTGKKTSLTLAEFTAV